MALAVVAGLTGNLWLLVAMTAMLWGLIASGFARSRQVSRATRWLAGVGASVGLALLVAAIVLGDPSVFLAPTSVIVVGGLVGGTIYAIVSQFMRGPEPESPE